MWVGIDDTDGPDGGCTTYTALLGIHALQRRGFDLTGHPRLVRLNPNIPWKTRGNGALSFHIGKGRGTSMKAGMLDGIAIRSFSEAEALTEKEAVRAFEILKDIVERSRRSGDNTNPGLVMLPEPPSENMYWRAVREVVKPDSTREYLKLQRMAGFVRAREWGNGRGLIGATASIAWPAKKHTFEILGYRDPGVARNIPDEEVLRIDREFPTTFNNFDETNRHCAIVPKTPCPILFGIRGTDPSSLISAKDIVSQKVKGWLLFQTNQATGDHLVKQDISAIREYGSVILEGTVADAPEDRRGGHMFFSLAGEGNDDIVSCAAFEPTKEFREIVRKLVAGDRIEAWGGVKKNTVNLEGIRILELSEVREKVSNPRCTDCNKAMKSVGSGQGYKCPVCGKKAGVEEAEFKNVDREVKTGIHIVPVCARRHLTDIGLFDRA